MGALETLQGGSAPHIPFKEVGDRVKGEILAITERQDSDYDDPAKLKWWNRDDGPDRGNPADRPKMIVVFTLQTEIRDSEEDDGIRTVWARGNCFSAVSGAIRKVLGAKYTEKQLIGGTLKVIHDRLGEKKPRMNAPKLFSAAFERPPVATTDEAQDGETETAKADAAKMDW